MRFLREHWRCFRGVFTASDVSFLLLRLSTVLGGYIWLLAAPLSSADAIDLFKSLIVFFFYSLFIYLLIFLNPARIRQVYGLSLILDLFFIYWMVHLQNSFANSFFLGYYLLVALHSFYFGISFGLLAAALATVLYSLNFLPFAAQVHWTELGIRVSFLFLIALPLGFISQKMQQDRKRIEELNRQLADSLESLERMQDKMVRSEKLLALGRLTSDIAHEIRNPLSALGGLNRRMLKTLPPESKERKYAETIAREVNRLEAILRDIVTLTMVGEHLQRDDINRVIAGAVSYARTICLEGERVRLVENYAPDLPRVYLEPDQLRQVMGQLVCNAVDAIEGEGVITISTGTRFKNEILWVTVSVHDTGPGIPEEQMERLFEPFYSTKRTNQVTGLGLAIVHKIMEDHRGFVQVESGGKGEGTTFTLYFPYQPEEEDGKKPCWEYLHCGIESDPSRSCPAYPYFGRICWAIAGTLCEGKVMGTFAEKTHDCRQCPVFQDMWRECRQDGREPECPRLLGERHARTGGHKSPTT
ncbi:MAG TPA: sensor histidine kinase [Desulfobulbus sp.]|nr:sensor histidine kinase [Desulfobulbus sp.]